MRVSETQVMTPSRGTATVSMATPARAFGAVRGNRPVPLAPRAARLVVANAVLGVALLIWFLPSPWGGMVPVAMLAQAVWYRHGTATAVVGLLAAGGVGAVLGQLLGTSDWRRTMVAMSLLALSAALAWPARASSARR
jgi:VIT1/CCC1 family predicted Fe2+/Mn2+ transporter